MEENMKKIVFTFALVAAMCVCSIASISAWEEDRFRFHFRTVSFPDDTFTQLLGINDSDMIAGYHGATVNKGFVFTFPNNFAAENFPASAQTQVIGINNRGYTDGFYISRKPWVVPAVSISTALLQLWISPAQRFNQLLGLNNLDQAVGYYADVAGRS